MLYQTSYTAVHLDHALVIFRPLKYIKVKLKLRVRFLYDKIETTVLGFTIYMSI